MAASPSTAIDTTQSIGTPVELQCLYTASVSLTREIVYSLGSLRTGVTEKRPKKAALCAPQMWLKAVLGLKPGAETPGDTTSKEHSCLVPF